VRARIRRTHTQNVPDSGRSDDDGVLSAAVRLGHAREHRRHNRSQHVRTRRHCALEGCVDVAPSPPPHILRDMHVCVGFVRETDPLLHYASGRPSSVTNVGMRDERTRTHLTRSRRSMRRCSGMTRTLPQSVRACTHVCTACLLTCSQSTWLPLSIPPVASPSTCPYRRRACRRRLALYVIASYAHMCDHCDMCACADHAVRADVSRSVLRRRRWHVGHRQRRRAVKRRWCVHVCVCTSTCVRVYMSVIACERVRARR
jgi:hypothetical protein